jgi:hypothetical protein
MVGLERFVFAWEASFLGVGVLVLLVGGLGCLVARRLERTARRTKRTSRRGDC